MQTTPTQIHPRSHQGPVAPPPPPSRTTRRSGLQLVVAVLVTLALIAGTGVAAFWIARQQAGSTAAQPLQSGGAGTTVPSATEAGESAPDRGPATDANPPTQVEPVALDTAGLPEPAASVRSIADAAARSDEGDLHASGDISIDVGGGQLVLRDADLEVVDTAGADQPAIAAGVATLELPTVGAMTGAFIDRELRGNVGMATGAELEFLHAHLRAERTYLYADLGSQPFELFLDLDSSYEGAQSLPQRISTVASPGGSVMFVADTIGDYFYLSTPCEAMIPAGTDNVSRPASKKQNPHADADAAAIPGVSLDLTGFDPGGCGIGWSAQGTVPFVPMFGERMVDFPDDFGAHLVVDGTVPVAHAATLDGELFYRFASDQVAVWANGELDVGVPFFKGAAEVTLPAAQGTYGLSISNRSIDMWITASAGRSAQDGSPVELLADLAPIRGQLDLDGELHISDGELQPTSFLQLSGDVSIAPTPIRTNSGVEVNDLFAAEGLARIDATGITIRGTMQSSPLGPLALNGAAELEFLVPFADPSESYLEVTGSLAVGDTDLGADAHLRVDKSGAFARGTLELAGMAAIDVEGWLGADGFQLTGSAQATLPIGDLDKVAASLVDQTSNDQVIRTLNAQIDARIAEIAATDPAKGAELRTTVGDMRAAFEDIASVRETIAYNDSIIAQRWRDHQADIDWHWALNDWDRFWDKGPHAIRLGAILAEIEALKLANTVQYGYIDVANSVVSLTQQTVIAIIGWDGELNALLTLQTEAYLGTLAGNFVATVLNGADAILDAFGVDGSATGTVTFTVGTQGVGATADLQWCRDGACETLAGAVVELAPSVRVCGTILGVEACAAI